MRTGKKWFVLISFVFLCLAGLYFLLVNEEDPLKGISNQMKTMAEMMYNMQTADKRDIDFYGKLTDKDGKAIAGADVSINIKSGTILLRQLTIKTKNDGSFSIKSEKGHSLYVDNITKPGFQFDRVAQKQTKFSYIRGYPKFYIADPAKPAPLFMRKKYAKAKVRESIFRSTDFKDDMIYYVDLDQGLIRTEERIKRYSSPFDKDLSIVLKRDKKADTHSLVINVVQQSDGIMAGELDYIAPKEGYLRQLILKGEDHIQGKRKILSYAYLQQSNGDVYRRLYVRMIIRDEGNRLYVKTFTNLSGTRSLEHD